MTSSPRNACICVFFLTYWNSCILPGNALQLRSWLGCPVLVPCHGRSADSDSFSWFYKENEHSKETRLYIQDKTGVKHFGTTRKGDFLANRTLFISKFTEKDEGIYWCQNCHQDGCKSTSIITVQREIMDEIHKTTYIVSGSFFTQTCPGEFSTFKWTFEPSNTTQNRLNTRSEVVTVTTNKTLYTGPVQNTDAGEYTCWASRCDGPSQKVLTINLCVITFYQRVDSPPSCAATCDVDLNNLTDSSGVLMSNRALSVDIDPSGSLICSLSEILDEHVTTTNSYTSSVTLRPTLGVSWKTENFMPVVYGVLAVLTFFTLLAFLSGCFKSRIQAAFPFHHLCCGYTGEEEEESTVVYSSVITRTPPKPRNQHTDGTDCVYSELKL